MSKVSWTGNAAAVKQVRRYTFGGTWEANDVITASTVTAVASVKSLVVVAGSTITTTVVNAIVAAWNDSAIPEFAEVTASREGSDLVLTGDVAGKPFDFELTTTENGGGAADDQEIDSSDTSTGTDTTPCSGPNFWSVDANWNTGAVPVNGDDVYFENGNVDCLYGLDQSGVDLDSLNIAASYRGRIGLPNWTGQYAEYRDRRLSLGTATVLKIGYGSGPGSSRLRINTGSNACACQVERTAEPENNEPFALDLVGNDSGNTYELLRGNVGICMQPGDTGTGAVQIGYVTNKTGDVTVAFGDGFTFQGDTQIGGGEVVTNTNAGTVAMTDGQWTHNAGTATPKVYGGTLYWNSADDMSNPVIGPRGSIDFSRDMSAKSVTDTVLMSAGATLNDPFGVAAPEFQAVNCLLSDLKVNVGPNKTFTPG